MWFRAHRQVMVRARAEPSRALIIMSYVVMATSNLLGSLSTCAQCHRHQQSRRSTGRGGELPQTAISSSFKQLYMSFLVQLCSVVSACGPLPLRVRRSLPGRPVLFCKSCRAPWILPHLLAQTLALADVVGVEAHHPQVRRPPRRLRAPGAPKFGRFAFGGDQFGRADHTHVH